MGSTLTEKTAEDLRKEIDELHRQQREITERLRDPRGLRRGGNSNSPRGFGGANGVAGRQRGFVRHADRVNSEEDQPPPKRRLSSAVVKVEDGEIEEDVLVEPKDAKSNDLAAEGDDSGAADESNMKKSLDQPQNRAGFSRRDANLRRTTRDFDLPTTDYVPRVLPKNEDASLVNRNKRILGQLLGTLEKFRKEDSQLSSTEAYMRRSDSLKRAEQKAREESERLRQQEREKIAENRRRDMTLRARVAAKAEEKKLELLFLQWSEHHKRLCNFLRTKAEPPIYYMPTKPLHEDAALIEENKEQAFQEWKTARREELSGYQKQIGEQCFANVEKDLERWQNIRNRRNNNVMNLQETMDKELETHQLEHGPKTRKIPGNNDDEDDVEDINVGEDDMMDDVLEADDNSRRAEDVAKPDVDDSSPPIDAQ
ncbi:hypothetical protein Scep_019304 [Stephania cephalantha]|uniref:Pinin/SDK/MemA protein domain-containing protein n=1 Tax=Stephania cephalantha TaxID=152367 RepID=A0AAP0IAN6_9MAGN